MKSLLNIAMVIFLVIFMTGGLVLGVVWSQDNSKEAADKWEAPLRASKKSNPVPADEKSITLGKKIYIRECLSCHGVTGKGDGPAAKDLERPVGNLQDSHFQEHTDGALFWKITQGKKPMPTFEKTLTEEERWVVINYIRTLVSSEVDKK